MKRKLLWIFGILVLLIIIGKLNEPAKTKLEAPQVINPLPLKPKPAQASRPSRPLLGETGKIDPDNGSAAVALTDKAYDALTKAAVAKDTVGFAALFANGQAVEVDSGTKIQVIESGWTSVKIRILEGKHFGKAGWIPVDRVVK